MHRYRVYGQVRDHEEGEHQQGRAVAAGEVHQADQAQRGQYSR